MRIPPAVRIAAVTLLGACTTATPGASNQDPNERVRIVNAPVDLTLNNSPDVRARTVNAPLADVWRVLPQVMDSLGIPVGAKDASTGTIGNAGFDVRRLLGRTMVTRYFDCGEHRGGSSALSYDLFVSVMTRARANESGGTDLLTTTTVRGRPITYSGSYIPCASLGLLEQRIADGVGAALGK